MDWVNITYTTTLHLSSAVSIFLALLVWRRRPAPGTVPFTLLLIAIAEWTLANGGQVSSAHLSGQLFWAKLQYPGIVTIPVAWLLFVSEYTGQGRWLNSWKALPLAVVPIVIVVLTWTNDLHHWMWTGAALHEGRFIYGLALSYNVGFWVHAVYSHLLILSGLALLWRAFLRAPRDQRRHFLGIITGVTLPLLANLGYVLGIGLNPAVDFTPLTFFAATLIVGWSVRKILLLDIIPFAHRAVIDGMNDGVIVLDVQHRIMDLNQAASLILDRPPAEVVGRHALQVFPNWPVVLGIFDRVTQNSHAEHGPYHEVIWTQGGEKRCYDLHISPLQGRFGLLSGHLLVFSDITERKLSEEALRESEERFAVFMDHLPAAAFIKDSESRNLYYNQRMKEILGPGDWMGQSSYGSLPEEQAQAMAADDQKALREGALVQVETLIDPEGTERTYQTYKFPILRQGKPTLLGGVGIDITDRVRAERALRRQLEELTVLHGVASACVEATSENELVERATQVIGETLYPDNFGILVFDPWTGKLSVHPSYRGLRDEKKTGVIQVGQGVTGAVAETGLSRRIPDVQAVPEYIRYDPRTRSELCVPIKVGEHVIGVFNAESAQPDAFSEADERVLTILAGQLATAIEHLRAEAAERQRLEELSVITRVSRDISSLLDHQQVMDAIVRHAAQLSGSEASGLFTYHPDGHFYLVAAHGVEQELVQQLNAGGVPMEGSLLGQAVRERHPVQVPDVQTVPDYPMLPYVKRANIHAILALPMLREDEVMGGLVLWQQKPCRFSERQIIFLQALAQESINAIENARLFKAEHEQRRLAEVLRETGATITATLDLDKVLDGLLEQAARLMTSDTSSLMMIEGRHARVARSRGFERFGEIIVQEVADLVFDLEQTANLRQVVETRKPLIIPDIHTYSELFAITCCAHIASWIGVPVIEQDRVVAIFTMDSVEVNHFPPEAAERLAVFAGQAGLALQHARLFAEAQQRLRENTLLGKVITITASATDMVAAMAQICEEVAHFFSAQQAAFALMNAEGTVAEVIAEYRDEGRPSALQVQIPVEGNPSMAYVIEKKVPLAISGAQTNPLLKPIQDLMRMRDIYSILLVPIHINGMLAGTLGVDILEPRDFLPADVEMMKNVASQISQSLERLRLFQATQEHANQMAKLAILSSDLNRPLTVAEVLSGIGQGAMALGQADRAAVWVRGPGDLVSCPWVHGLSSSYVSGIITNVNQVPGSLLLQSVDPVLVSDNLSLTEDSPLRDLTAKEEIRAFGLWPLVYQGVVIAVVGCYYDTVRGWTKGEREVMLALSRQAAVALQNARLFEETRRRAAQQEAVNAIIAAAVTAPDILSLLKTALELTLKALDCPCGEVWVSGHRFSLGLSQDGAHTADRIRSNGKYGHKTLAIENWAQLAGADPVAAQENLPEEEIRSSLFVPILTENRPTGGFALAQFSPRSWTNEEIALVEAVGQQLGVAVERLTLLAKTQEQARQVRQIVDTVPDGVLLLDAERKVVIANPVAWDHLKALTGDHDYSTPLVNLAGHSIDTLLKVKETGLWSEIETGGSSPKIFEVASHPLQVGDHREGWVMVLRDMTKARESQNRIEMQERLATVGQLAAGIAHDFSNIMAAIVVYADLLSLEPNLKPASRDQLAIIQQQIQRATILIRQILDFSRRSILEQSKLDLLPFFKELDKILGRILPETIRLELTHPPGACFVRADPTHLQQVFMNLALNARDAMPAGGTLQFELNRIHLAPKDLTEFSELSPGNWICIRVKDSGTGIPPEVFPHVFDPFFTTKPIGEGTGLGLAQVYGIIKQHNGTIEVESQAGAGTTFTIYLPALEAPLEPDAGEEMVIGAPGNGETILVVEDDAMTRDALKVLLETQNYQVLTASNGLEALKVYEQHEERISLVVSDVMMPKMGGIALYRELQRKKPQIRALFMTGHPMENENLSTLEGGQVCWMQKPFSVNEFTQALHDLIEVPA